MFLFYIVLKKAERDELSLYQIGLAVLFGVNTVSDPNIELKYVGSYK